MGRMKLILFGVVAVGAAFAPRCFAVRSAPHRIPPIALAAGEKMPATGLLLAAAPAGQAPAMIVTLAAWMIALTEAYRSTHLIPSVFLYLIFWSLMMVSVLGLLAGS